MRRGESASGRVVRGRLTRAWLFPCALCAAACLEHVDIAGGDTGAIRVDPDDGPGEAPELDCDLPALECEGDAAYCAELVQFVPFEGVGYIDYAEYGESAAQERSWLRRDFALAVEYAAAVVACEAERWDLGNGGPVGLIDMSAEDGSNPGGYWEGTHEGGLDIAIAYFQSGTADNRLRDVCEHTSGGAEQYHCVEAPSSLDRWRTALFLGALQELDALRVIGMDGEVGPLVADALQKLCADGWLGAAGCAADKLAWEETDTGLGWYYSHYAYMQASMNAP